MSPRDKNGDDPIVQLIEMIKVNLESTLLSLLSRNELYSLLTVYHLAFKFQYEIAALSEGMSISNVVQDLYSAVKNQDLAEFQFVLQFVNRLSAVVNGSCQNLPEECLLTLTEQAYSLTVSPHLKMLRGRSSSQVFGELLEGPMRSIIETGKLAKNSVFVDIGSGAGDLVIKIAVITGCRTFGIECNMDVANLAEQYLSQVRFRAGVYGIPMEDIQVELEFGDACSSSRLSEQMSTADVVLVNNQAFDEPCA